MRKHKRDSSFDHSTFHSHKENNLFLTERTLQQEAVGKPIMTMNSPTKGIDSKFLDRQSRTIGTYGLETMTKLISFKVVIVGCGGLGIETAKNLALAGVHSIILCDVKKVELKDLGVNFAVTKAAIDAGVSRAEASQRLISELNPNVRVKVVPALTEAVVGGVNAVVYTSDAADLSLRTLTHWDNFCNKRSPAISFIFVYQGGALGSVFTDHGPKFVVKDSDGRPPNQKSITEVLTKVDKKGDTYTRVRYETPEGQTPGSLRDYTKIKFTEVKGLRHLKTGESINNRVFAGVVCTSDPPDTLRIYPALENQGFSPYETGGFIHELKEVTELQFFPLSQSLRSPGGCVSVNSIMDASEDAQSHLALNALLRFFEKYGRLPKLHDGSEADVVVAFAKTINSENQMARNNMSEEAYSMFLQPEREEFPLRLAPPPKPQPLTVEAVDESYIRKQSLVAAASLQPLCAFLGAVVAQEIVKITGKYTPICQWLYINTTALLPDSEDYINSHDYKPCGSRYDHFISILGKKFQEQLGNLSVFMVGCGALGCENLKNFALCGVACGPKGSLVVSDNDRIEISNLSRQFLFREDNVGQFKSVAACSRMLTMNDKAKVDARQDYIGPKTEHIFHDKFWAGLDVVVSALDNMETRLYVDQQCVRFRKILVEAGTMGTGGNIDIIVPCKTSSYADGGAADASGGIPMCTLRNFPYIFDHCIEWARAQFDDLFVSPMQKVVQFIEDPKAFIERIRKEVDAAQSSGERLSILERQLVFVRSVHKVMSIITSGVDMEKCVQCAWETMFLLFRDRIFDLQHSFPRDTKKKNGEAFWSGHRKYPKALEVDSKSITSNHDVAEFLIAASNLFACMFGVHPQKHEARLNVENNRWMQEYRTTTWLASVTAKRPIVVYSPCPVEGLDDDIIASVGQVDKETNTKSDIASKEQQLQEIIHSLIDMASKCKGLNVNALDFEKDDDDNFHIDFVTAASNLRASNYEIPTQDRIQVKLVAGKIIPAIATTTSAVTGLALIEYLKAVFCLDLSCLRNGMIDLGTNNYVLFARDEPIKKRTEICKTYLVEQDYTYKKKVIRIPDGFTKYDTIPIPVAPQTTVQEFAVLLEGYLNKTLPANVESQYEVSGIGVGTGLLWNGMKKHANTTRSLMEVIEQQKVLEAGGKLCEPFWQNRTHFFDLSVTVSFEDGDDSVDELDVETATIVLHITSKS